MGAYKQIEISEIEDATNDNLFLFENNEIQLFTYPEAGKLTPVKDILTEMKMAFEKSFAATNHIIS